MRPYKSQNKRLEMRLIRNNLLEVVQSGLGLLLCFLVEVFWNGYEDSLSFCAYPGHFQLKFLLLVVLVDQVNAGYPDQI